MPTYEYMCLDCDHRFSDLRAVADREIDHGCPQCGGATHREYRTAPNMQAFVGSDRHRSQRDNWLQMVEEAQNEPIRSQTELEVGLEQAHDRAKAIGVSPERILGPKGTVARAADGAPQPSPAETKARLKKQAVDQHNLIHRSRVRSIG